MPHLDPTRLSDGADELLRSLRRNVIGQDEAVTKVVEAYESYGAGLADRTRPVASFLFLGPSGTGKTRTVEATAEALLGNPRAVLKIDCAEYQHGHEIAKLTGSPPGYLGHRDTAPALNQEALDGQHTAKVKLSFVLFDEVEKAGDSLWNLLLGILDKALITTGTNTPVSFSRSMVFLTANVGSRQISDLMEDRWGFSSGQRTTADASKRAAKSGLEAARRKFPPEFLNRLDQVVVFQPLSTEALRQILDLEIEKIQTRILGTLHPFTVRVSEAAREYLLREGTSIRYGARELRRVLEHQIMRPLASIVSSGQLGSGMGVQVDHDGAGLVFDRWDAAVVGVRAVA